MIECISSIATVISAACAAIAVISAVIINHNTRKLIKRTGRPYISLFETHCRKELSTIHLALVFKNIGENPAKDLSITIAGSPKKELASLKKLSDILVVNRKDPGVPFTCKVEIVPVSTETGKNEIVDFLFCVSMVYTDVYDPTRTYHEPWYFEYRVGNLELRDMSREDSLALQPYINKIRTDKLKAGEYL